MGYRAIRMFGVLSIVITVLIFGGGIWQMFAPGSRSAQYLPAPWLVFLLIGFLAIRVSVALEDQSRAIDSLKERLAQLQPK